MTNPSVRSWPLPKIILFLVLGFVFLTHALLAEFIGVKIFSLNDLLGWRKDGFFGDFRLYRGVCLIFRLHSKPFLDKGFGLFWVRSPLF
ncbi:MAG: hypothetical protein EBR22_05440, partial [Cytophagia bacterium]|nr:hypothetical protein [Cytophagia bacterium]